MGFFPLALVAGLTIGGTAGGQTPDSAGAPIHADLSDQQPSQYVAAQVRRILTGSSETADWVRLEIALAENGWTPTSSASAMAPFEAIALPSPSPRPEQQWIDEPFDSVRAAYVVGGVIILTVALLVLVAVRRYLTRTSISEDGFSGKMDRRSQVRTLAATGVPISDIVRRSGLSRDAVGVLMRIQAS